MIVLSFSGYCTRSNVHCSSDMVITVTFLLFEKADLNRHKLWNTVIPHLNFLKTGVHIVFMIGFVVLCAPCSYILRHELR